MERIFTGKLFQSEGALNIKAFLIQTQKHEVLKRKALQYVLNDEWRKKEPKTVLDKQDN